jgi:SAM-dependent methyltransferase
MLSQPRIKHRNPWSSAPLRVEDGAWVDDSGARFPKVGGVWRFVEGQGNYAESFGFQWTRFERTQIDGHTSSEQSRRRWAAETGWLGQTLEGQCILEVGSGAGRFSRVILEHTSADLYSIDYSSAVDANFRNNGEFERLHLYQASIYEMPFEPAQFDKVFCLGVLQHTPDVRKSVASLIHMVRPGGELVVDFYAIKGFWTYLNAKYLLRPFAKRLGHQRLLETIERNIDWMLALTNVTKGAGLGTLNRFIPICNVSGTFPKDLTPEQVREWAVLDTFDMFSPEFDQPQRLETVRRWFMDLGLEDVVAAVVHHDSGEAHVVRGRKPVCA